MDKILALFKACGRYIGFVSVVFIALAVGFVAAFIVGLVWMFSAKLIYLPFIHPFIAAWVVGSVLRAMISKQNAIIIAVIGLLVGSVLYSTFRVSEYSYYVSTARQLLQEQLTEIYPNVPDSTIDVIVDQELQAYGLLGEIGFLNFIFLQAGAEYGLQLHTDLLTIPLPPITDPSLIFLYWLIEIVIVLWTTITVPMGMLDEV